MTESRKTIVVLGATGQQGGSVIRALLADGRWELKALVRNPDADAAHRLAAQNVSLIKGNLDDYGSLKAAFSRAHGIYSVQASSPQNHLEVRQGIAVADAARETGIAHFVYGSVGGADRRSAVPHFETKWRIEQHIREIGLPASIVRPVFFMDNFLRPTMRAVLLALMQSYVPDDKELQMIAVDDIGKWVARAFAEPTNYIGQSQEIAGDSLTREHVIQTMKRHGWHAGLPFPVPKLLLRALPNEILRMFEWFGAAGYAADIIKLKRQQPEIEKLDMWLSKQAQRSSIR